MSKTVKTCIDILYFNDSSENLVVFLASQCIFPLHNLHHMLNTSCPFKNCPFKTMQQSHFAGFVFLLIMDYTERDLKAPQQMLFHENLAGPSTKDVTQCCHQTRFHCLKGFYSVAHMLMFMEMTDFLPKWLCYDTYIISCTHYYIYIIAKEA